MLCCVRTRARKEGNYVDDPLRAAAPAAAYAYDEKKKGKPVTQAGILKDGNMVVLAGAGATVAATAAAVAVVSTGGGGCGVAGVGEPSGGEGGPTQGCCCSGGASGGCGGCGG